MPHIIRLRGPWEFRVVLQLGPDENPELALPAGRVEVPCDWSASLGGDFCGRVVYRRPFKWPAQLEPGQSVTLVFDGVRQSAQVQLNGKSLGSFGPDPAWLDITSLLKPHNELLVEVVSADTASGPGGLIGEVRLEIE
jgi:hypothetical protein